MSTLSRTRGRPPAPIGEHQDATKIFRRRQQWLAYYYRTPDLDTWARAALHNSRRRALRAEVVHTLTSQQIASLLPQDGLCPILGIKLSISKGNKACSPHTATIDRINPDGPYVLDNCHVISHLANRGKAHMSIAQLVQLGQWAARMSIVVG